MKIKKDYKFLIGTAGFMLLSTFAAVGMSLITYDKAINDYNEGLCEELKKMVDKTEKDQ